MKRILALSVVIVSVFTVACGKQGHKATADSATPVGEGDKKPGTPAGGQPSGNLIIGNQEDLDPKIKLDGKSVRFIRTQVHFDPAEEGDKAVIPEVMVRVFERADSETALSDLSGDKGGKDQALPKEFMTTGAAIGIQIEDDTKKTLEASLTGTNVQRFTLLPDKISQNNLSKDSKSFTLTIQSKGTTLTDISMLPAPNEAIVLPQPNVLNEVVIDAAKPGQIAKLPVPMAKNEICIVAAKFDGPPPTTIVLKADENGVISTSTVGEAISNLPEMKGAAKVICRIIDSKGPSAENPTMSSVTVSETIVPIKGGMVIKASAASPAK